TPTEKDLLDLEARDGIAAFLRLRNVPKWSDDAKANEEARKNAEDLITQVQAAVRKVRTDPDRINRFLRALNAGPEEREYALRELQKSGAAVVPHLIDALLTTDDTDERGALLGLIPSLDKTAVPALLASLDVDKPVLQADLLAALQRRRDTLALMNNSLTD